MRKAYAFLWRDRRFAAFMAASLAGRTGFAMVPLALVLFLRSSTGSIAAAGAALGAFGLTGALHPVRGRLIDRYGRLPLAGFGIAFGAGLGALVIVGLSGGSVPLVVGAAALAGLFIPPLGPFGRAILSLWLREDGTRLQRAYAADSALEEFTLVLGPVAVAVLVAVASPAAAVVAAAIATVLGSLSTATSALARGAAARGWHRGPGEAATGEPASRRLSGRLVPVLVVMAGVTIAMGCVDVAVPVFAQAHGSAADAGLLLGLLAAGSALGGLLYGARQHGAVLERRYAALTGVLAVCATPAIFAGSIIALAPMLVLLGGVLGPLFIVLYALVDRDTHAGQRTRAFSWVVSVTNGGAAAGAAGAGALMASQGTQAGFVLCWLAALGGAMAAAVMLVRLRRAHPTITDSERRGPVGPRPLQGPETTPKSWVKVAPTGAGDPTPGTEGATEMPL